MIRESLGARESGQASGLNPARIGVVGLGVRTEVLLVSLFGMPEVEIVALCDRSDKAIGRIEAVFAKHGVSLPRIYRDYHELLAYDDVDAVLIPTSWNSHLPIAADTLAAGKYAAIEVGGASSTEELWQLVHASERTGVSCMMLENCCYARNELLVLNMARQGLFGEIVHCAGGYEHDLREYAIALEHGYERSVHNRFRNADLYPTHQLGPIAKILHINRGNRFLSLTSTASKSRGMQAMRREHFGCGSDQADLPFNKGDVVTTVIKCAGGETITLTHCISLPRPYSRNGRVQGTHGIWLEDAQGVYLDGHSPSEELLDVAGNPYTRHFWEPLDAYYEKYEHPIWRRWRDRPLGGHGGADSLALRAFVDAVQRRGVTPIDVYDCAAWMSVTCLSEQSIAMGSQPVAFPDFTNGKWMTRETAPVGDWTL